MKSCNILLTCAGGDLYPQIYRMLKQSKRYNFTVVAVDMNPNAIGRHFSDYFHTVPSGKDKTYLKTIKFLCQKYDIDMILPRSDEEAMVMSACKTELMHYGKPFIACVDFPLMKIVSNKLKTYEHLLKLGIPVADYKVAHSVLELSEHIDHMLPIYGDLVVKPSDSRGGRGVYVLDEKLRGEELIHKEREIHMSASLFKNAYLKNYPYFPAIVTQRLLDPVHDIDLLGWRGKPVRIVPRCRTHSKDPNQGVHILVNSELYRMGEALISGLGISSLLDADVMYGSDGKPYVIEVNPRPSGSVAFSMMAGCSLIDDLFALHSDDPIEAEVVLNKQTLHAYKALIVEKA